jgi:hypothetical protein
MSNEPHHVEELTHSSMTRPDWVTDMGDYNTMPQPHRPCSIHRFLHMIGIYSPKSVERRQVVRSAMNQTTMENVSILWFHNCGFAVVHPTKWTTGEKGIEYDLTQVRFMEIGCDHKYRELSQAECGERGISHHGNCWHVEECETCKHVHSYDSSG